MDSKTYSNERHSTHYLEAGPEDGTPMIFVHGWPELSLSWRHQLRYFSERGFRCIAPDMRGYGKSANYTTHADYEQRQVVQDMLDLADGLGIEQAIWVGHDWGAPTVWNLARHHPARCIGVANLCVPYHTLERGWDGVLPYIDRSLYPEDEFPAGQWEYQCFYEENFEDATAAFDADPEQMVKLMFRKGNPEGAGQVAGTALVRKQGGWFGGGDMPQLPHDPDVVTEADIAVYAEGLARNSFFGPDSYYMNHERNAAYCGEADDHTLARPVLFLHGRYDYTCETLTSTAAEPMRANCQQLTEHVVASGHWMAQERPDDVNRHLAAWLDATLNLGDGV